MRAYPVDALLPGVLGPLHHHTGTGCPQLRLARPTVARAGGMSGLPGLAIVQVHPRFRNSAAHTGRGGCARQAVGQPAWVRGLVNIRIRARQARSGRTSVGIVLGLITG